MKSPWFKNYLQHMALGKPLFLQNCSPGMVILITLKIPFCVGITEILFAKLLELSTKWNSIL